MLASLSAFLVLSLAPAQQVGAPTWEQLRAVYDYPNWNLDLVKSTDRAAPEGTYSEFTFPSEMGGTAYGTFVRPNTKGPFPLVVLIHGLNGERKALIGTLGKQLLAKDFAVLAIDAPHHGQRSTPEDGKLLQSMLFKFIAAKDKSQGLGAFMFRDDAAASTKFAIETIGGGVRDLRRAIDWATSPGHRVDKTKIATVGVSLGAMMSSILAGVDPRINAQLLVIGGDPVSQFIGALPADQRLLGASIAPSNFLGHTTSHVLMLNGYNDTVITRADTQRLYESAPGITLVFFDTPGDMAALLGHAIPAEGYALGVDWLSRMVSAPRPEKRVKALPFMGR